LLPVLEERWPHLPERISTVASQQAANLQVLEDMARIDLVEAMCDERTLSCVSQYRTVSRLSITRLKQLSAARLHNLLRYWIKDSLINDARSPVHTPTRNLLLEVERTLIQSMNDSNPVLNFSDYQFRRFQDVLYLMYAPVDGTEVADISWDTSQVLELPALNCRLLVKGDIKNGLDKKLLGEKLMISFRKGGEHLHPVSRHHSRSLKKLFQEAGVAPWDRETIPLLYYGDELIAVVGLWLARDFTVGEGERGWDISVENL
jgi:tRNA(Ile)-lysidine synthase